MEIDGKKIAKKILGKLKSRVEEQRKKGKKFCLCIIQTTSDPQTSLYIREKEKAAKELGVEVIKKTAKTEKELFRMIRNFNENKEINGIIVQRPLPKNFDREKIIYAVAAKKDIDGFRDDSLFKPPIWLAIREILKFVKRKRKEKIKFDKWLREKRLIVIGKGETGGYPIIKELNKLKINPIVIESRTRNRGEIIKNADIVISAVGKKTIKKEWLKKGVILISVGLRREKGRVVGDYDEEEISDIASFYTPTPGGVGPLNVAFLFKNLVNAGK